MRPWLRYITINGRQLPYPNDFSLQKVPNIVNEMTTLTGKVVADINGWRYGDTELKWGTLLGEDLQNLLAAISSPSFQVSFYDIDGIEQTVNAVLKGRANVKTPMFYNGLTVWKDVSISLSFPDCYEDQ
jgi:hypothetical protein